jgi:hypothetical protein
MQIFLKIAILFTIFANISISKAQTVRILAVQESGPTNVVEMALQMQEIQATLTRSPGNSVSIELVNGGVPEMLTGAITGSTNDQQQISARNNASLIQKRDAHIADLVVVFVDELPVTTNCGWGRNYYWQNGTGMFPSSGPDMRPQELYYVALVSRSPACNAFPRWHIYAAHEVGHLFGAGHNYGFFNGLIAGESYADFMDPAVRPDNIGAATIMTIPPDNNQCAGYTCFYLDQFSSDQTDNDPPYTTTYSNINAIKKTAPSVSMFREPCGLSSPTFMSGYIADICYGGNLETRHRVNWFDSCPQKSNNYKLYAQQPIAGFNPYNYFGTVFSATTYVLVNGTGSRIKAKSCEGLSCSSLSLSSYIAGYVECH